MRGYYEDETDLRRRANMFFLTGVFFFALIAWVCFINDIKITVSMILLTCPTVVILIGAGTIMRARKLSNISPDSEDFDVFDACLTDIVTDRIIELQDKPSRRDD